MFRGEEKEKKTFVLQTNLEERRKKKEYIEIMEKQHKKINNERNKIVLKKKLNATVYNRIIELDTLQITQESC